MGEPAPTRAATFLFTDIEGSTRAWEAYPAVMAHALARHDRLLRGAFKRHGGRIFKTVGDAFYCAFESAAAAVTAAVEAEHELAATQWPTEIGEVRVRMAIHTGRAIRQDGDYFGPTVNRAARLISIAHGGQIVISSAAAAELTDADIPGVSLRNLGSHRLKDLNQPETTYQVVAEGLRADFPALSSLDAHPNNLPSQLTSFIGRERELTTLQARLSNCRIVSIIGPGGVGKTRLALQLAAARIQDFADGVYFVPLAPIGDGTLTINAVASALQIVELVNEPLQTTVLRYIGAKQILIVLDNTEHVSTHAASLVKSLVMECRNVRCLVTSREPLHLLGEDVERLAPLGTLQHAGSIAQLQTCETTHLFLERAQAVAGDKLLLSSEECELVAQICNSLDGIPLAVELAASRLATMPLSRLAERLSVSILVNKDPTAAARHRTLRDAIEWSYRLLGDKERHAFLALAVFVGGCEMEALERVAGVGVDDPIGSLVDKSLVQMYFEERGRGRYRLLQPIAEFASGELVDAGLSDTFRSRHLGFCRSLAQASVNASGESRQNAFQALDSENSNVRAALAWAAEWDIGSAAQLASELGIYWRARASFSEARSWFERLLDHSSSLTPSLHANLLRQSAGLAAMQDDYAQSNALAGAALAIFREIRSDAGIGLSLLTLGEVAHRQNKLGDAERLYRDALPHLEAASHRVAKTACLSNLAMIARQRADFRSAEKLLQEAFVDAKLTADPDLSAQVQIESAWASLSAGKAHQAEALFRDAFDTNVAEKNLHGVCYARLGIATVALVASRGQDALAEYRTALREAFELHAQLLVLDAIYGIGAAHAVSGDVVAAAKFCGLAQRLEQEAKCGARWGIAYSMVTEALREKLDQSQLARAMAAGAAMEVEGIIAGPDRVESSQ